MGPGAVLITRPEPGASETAARIAAMGRIPIVAPLLRIQPLKANLPAPGRIAAILLTSASAVEPIPPAWRNRPALTVGAATARRARAAGFANVVSADGDAVALASLVRTGVDPDDGTLLLTSGKGQGLALAAELRAAGYRVVRRVVYAAVPVARLPEVARQAITGSNPLTVLFFSAETARHFGRLIRAAGLAGALASREAITIGPQAGVALDGFSWSRVRVASQPNQDEMLALLR